MQNTTKKPMWIRVGLRCVVLSATAKQQKGDSEELITPLLIE